MFFIPDSILFITSSFPKISRRSARLGPPPTPETEAQVFDPQKEELSRQAREVMSGNVNPAQAEYFRQQNEELFNIKERKGANPTNIYNKPEEITGVNPVSNRRNDKMNELFGGLYGSEESRGF